MKNHHQSVSKKVMLATALVQIRYCGGIYTARALIDPCSGESFISKKLLNLVKLPTNSIDAEVTGLGAEVVSKIENATSFTLVSKRVRIFSIEVKALVVPHVTGKTPTSSIDPAMNLPDLEYANSNFLEISSVDMLLGGDIYPAIL